MHHDAHQFSRATYGRIFLFSFILALLPISSISAAPIADSAAKFIGNITTKRISPSTSTFTDYWNQVTPENEGKWGSIEAKRDTMNWKWLDTAYQFAKENHFLFKQHTFVWGNQEPSWISQCTQQEQREEVEEWIKAFGERYPDVDFIDVVNEPINKPASYREALGGVGTTGCDWVVWAFEKARQYCPKAKLILNEFNVLNSGAMTEGLLSIVNVLQSKNLIDMIGVQSHYFSLQTAPSDTIRGNLDKLSQTGLPIHSTELDIRGSDSVQLADYQRIFPILWEHPNVAGITLWGWMQNYTWNDSTYLLDKSGKERPAFVWLRAYVAAHKTSMVQAMPPYNKRPILPFSVRVTATGALLLHMDGPITAAIRITDCADRSIVNQPLRSFAPGDHRLPVQRLAAGVYIMAIRGNGAPVTRSFFVR
jgi:endo-1,4-beta-xylanase